MAKVRELHRRWSKDPEYRAAYDALDARIEGGKVRPSTDALERFVQATGTRLRITFEPDPVR